MITKLLVANRGAIAVRVFRTCRMLGISTVAVYSEADARALHTLSADQAVSIGPPPATDSYLNVAALIAAARATGADAVHPGYGFLSENPEFAQACIDAGLVWVGPPPAAMRAMASKIAAKRLAAQLGVPLLSGYQGDDQDDRTLATEAGRTGFPLLIKASAGGGGRGMRVVDDPADFADALASARREARAAFGDDAVLLERYVRDPRHIEIQVFADTHGNVIHLGERECSIQRRHQKVIEEAPSPLLSAALREEMGAAAVRLATAIGYTGAGTVEFLVDPANSSYAFLEMNTRLQVEHGVTELVTGLDLVQLQLQVAAGEPLPFRQEDVRLAGHAIQCRIYAEDPTRGYLPSSGRLTAFTPPTGAGIRNDVGVYAGAEVTPYYDPMLAKLLVYGDDRAAAIDLTAAALARYQIEGVTTNLELLRATVRHPRFVAGDLSTGLLDAAIVPALTAALPPVAALLGAAAWDLLRAGAPAAAGPWAAGPWRAAGVTTPLRYQHGGSTHMVTAVRRPGDGWQIEVGGAVRQVTLERTAADRVVVREGTAVTAYTVEEWGGRLHVSGAGGTETLDRVAPPSVSATGHATAGHTGKRTLAAPLAGVVVKVHVTEGESVAAHQPLVVLEAMKMEHTIEATAAAVVTRLHRATGDRVQAGDPLVELESV